MSVCAKCGVERGVINSRKDGLCKECGLRVDEEARKEAELRAAEQARLVYEECRQDIAALAAALTDEPPICITFISWDFQEVKDSGGMGKRLLSFGLGSAVGGIIGSIAVHNALFPGSQSEFSGELGIFVLTRDRVHIGHVTAPFTNGERVIFPEHVNLLKSKLSFGLLAHKIFKVRETQFFMVAAEDALMGISCGDESIQFKVSRLYAGDRMMDMPGPSEIQAQFSQLERLPTPYQFIKKLGQGENPLSAAQFSEIRNSETFINTIVDVLISFETRNELLANFSCLDPLVRASLEGRIKGLAAHRTSIKFSIIKWFAFTVVCGLGIALAEEFLFWVSIVGAVAGLIGIWANASERKRLRWCLDIQSVIAPSV